MIFKILPPGSQTTSTSQIFGHKMAFPDNLHVFYWEQWVDLVAWLCYGWLCSGQRVLLGLDVRMLVGSRICFLTETHTSDLWLKKQQVHEHSDQWLSCWPQHSPYSMITKETNGLWMASVFPTDIRPGRERHSASDASGSLCALSQETLLFNVANQQTAHWGNDACCNKNLVLYLLFWQLFLRCH